ncbi:MAG: ribbon-helix-helix protein, CopG family [Chloroflexota bacterium]
MKRRSSRPRSVTPVEQLSAFVGFDAVAVEVEHAPSPDTMRHIVSLRMPDQLLERVESAAHARGVSPSSLMRAFIAAGLDRSYAAVQEPDVAVELAALRRQMEKIVHRLDASGDAS